MREWHPRCQEPTCYLTCLRPGCRADFHYMARFDRARGGYFHAFDCTVDTTAAEQAVVELRPGMGPDEIAVARRVILEALDELERLRARTAPAHRPNFFQRWRRGHVA
jgi:hypothetical protein